MTTLIPKELIENLSGLVSNVQVFSSSGTYTRSAGVTKAIGIVVGASGGGASANGDNATAGGTTSLGSHLSITGGALGDLGTIDHDGNDRAADGVITGSDYAVIGSQPGGNPGGGYDGGGQWRWGQYGGDAPVAMKYFTPGATETITIGAAGLAATGAFQEGMDGKIGYIIIIELE